MRDEKTWQDSILPTMMDRFPPRIARDLKKYGRPKDVPPLGSYYVYGPTGTGKTILGAWMCLDACKVRYLEGKSMDVILTKTSELFFDLRRSYSDKSIDQHGYIEQHANTFFWVLDDFGSERPTDWVGDILYLLIDRRYENLATTVFTSNHSLDELAQAFADDRIPARIERMCKIIHKKKL